MKVVLNAFVLTCALHGVGCTSTQVKPEIANIQAFGEASAELTKAANETVEAYSGVFVEAQVSGLASLTGDAWLMIDEYQLNSTNVQIDRALKRAYGAETLEWLGKYGESLAALAAYDSVTPVDTAATQLSESLVSSNGTYKEFRGEELFDKEDIVNAVTLGNALGRAVTEEKKAKALRGLVESTNDGVQLACREIYETYKDGGTYSDAIEAVAGSVFTDRFSYGKRKYAHKEFAEKAQFIDASRKQLYALQHIDTAFNAVANSAQMLGQAHQQLYEALQENSLDFDNLPVLVAEMKTEKKRLQDFRDAITSSDEEE